MRQNRVLSTLAGCAGFLPSSVIASIISSPNVAAVNDPSYQDLVCRPPTKSSTDVVPPCIEIETIEILCTPNGTAPLYLAAHSQCMCNGSYFPEWVACQQCLFVHGLRNEQEMARYKNVLTTASNALCTGTPTAIFQSFFSSADNSEPAVTTGATTYSDQFPNRSEVSLYYTPSGRLGPGPITGEAASATNTALMTAERSRSTDMHSSATRSGGIATTPTVSGTVNVQTTTSTPNGALPTKAAGGLALAVAGVAWAAAF